MAASNNPIAAYVDREQIGPTELANRLGISKGSAHELITGKRGIGQRTARRMEKLTGKPWWKFMQQGVSA